MSCIYTGEEKKTNPKRTPKNDRIENFAGSVGKKTLTVFVRKRPT
jgi:hypothetical protein